MSRALVLLWLGTAPARAEHAADLDSWARSRIVTLTPPPSSPRSPDYGEGVATKWEDLLREAETAVDAGDPEATAKIAEAQRVLLEHPELPQSAFLRAALLRVQAEHVYGSDPARAAELVAHAVALEGPRAPRYRAVPRPELVVPTVAARHMALRGVRANDRTYVDGRLLTEPSVPAGHAHHVRVVREGQVVFAGWLEAPAGSTSVALPPVAVTPCSALDLAGVRIVGDRVDVPDGVSCTGWAVARPKASGGVEVARCHQARCGTLLPWSAGLGTSYTGPAQVAPERGGIPAWLGWGLTGVVAAAAGAFVLIQTGAFDGGAERQRGFEFIGPNAP